MNKIKNDFELYYFKAANALMNEIIWIEKSMAFYPGGRNGPYLDIESPVRNTAHCCLIFSFAYKLTGYVKYKTNGLALLQYLQNNDCYSYNDLLIHRQKSGKDWCNGTIGTAWYLEALYYGGLLLDQEKAVLKAKEIGSKIMFDNKTKLWNITDPSNNTTIYDRTYNHQSWLGSILAEMDVQKENVIAFLDASQNYLKGYSNGCIVHLVNVQKPDKQKKKKTIRQRYYNRIIRKYSTDKPSLVKTHIMNKDKRDVGYHLYVLYSLSRLKKVFKDHPLWKSETVTNALRYISSSDFIGDLNYPNDYSYPYNPPGFEYPMICSTFYKEDKILYPYIKQIWATQIATTWDSQLSKFSKNTCDPLTLSVRLYELGLYLYLDKNSEGSSCQQ